MKRLQAFLPPASIFTLALLVRIVYNVVVDRGYYPLHDSAFYQSIALNLHHEHCYCLHPYLSTVDRAPLWPFTIGIIYWVLGDQDRFVRFFLSFVGSGTCVLIYLFARDLFSKRIAILAGIVAALYPELYIYDGWLYSESLYIFLLLAFCYALYRLQRTPHRNWTIACGVLLGLLSLTRPNGLLVTALVILWAIIMGWKKILSWRSAAKNVIAIILISFIFVIPWTIRNYTVSYAFVPVATGDGKVLLGAYNDMIVERPDYLGMWILPDESTPSIAQPFEKNCAAPCEIRREATYKYYAGKWIQEHATLMPFLLGIHFINMWQPATNEADLITNRFPDRPTSVVTLFMMKTFPIPIFALAAPGLIVTRKQWRELMFIYLMILMTILQCIVFYGSPRFRAPIEPMLILLAMGAIWWFLNRRRKIEKVRTDELAESEVKDEFIDMVVADEQNEAFPLSRDLVRSWEPGGMDI